MGGLLYKDFVSVNKIGKFKITWLLLVYLIIFSICRCAFKDSSVEAFNEASEVINFADTIYFIFFVAAIIMLLGLINFYVEKISTGDDKGSVNNYLKSLPIDINKYVASKYIFVGIATYVFISYSYVIGIVFQAFCKDGQMLEWSELILGLLIPFSCLILLIASIELPLFLNLGKEMARLIKLAFWILLALFITGFLMFGDVKSFEAHFNANNIISFFNKHKMKMMIFETLSPVIILVLYYFSYRVACHFLKRKDV